MLPHCAGLWLLRPTPLTVRFMEALARRLMWDAPWQWDQTAWWVWVWVRVCTPNPALLQLCLQFEVPARVPARPPARPRASPPAGTT